MPKESVMKKKSVMRSLKTSTICISNPELTYVVTKLTEDIKNRSGNMRKGVKKQIRLLIPILAKLKSDHALSIPRDVFNTLFMKTCDTPNKRVAYIKHLLKSFGMECPSIVINDDYVHIWNTV